MNTLKDTFQILTWSEIKEQVSSVHPSLATAINEFDPDDSFKFVKISYRFGQSIMRDCELNVPISKHETSNLNHESVPALVKKQLDYRYIPIGLILNKKAEVFYESEDRVMPTKIFGAGSMIGLWENFDPEPSKFVKNVWNVSAGARSIFMLPKISNQTFHKNLKDFFHIQSYPPKSQLDHHGIFK